MQDTTNEQVRSLGDRLEKEKWDLKLNDYQTRLQEMDKRWVSHSQQLEIMSQKINGQSQAHDELGNTMRRLQERSADALALMAAGDLDACGTVSPYAAASSGLDEHTNRLKETEDRLETVNQELQMMRSDHAVGSHVAALVNTLEEVAPKVLNHEAVVKQVEEEITPKLASAASNIQKLQDETEKSRGGLNLLETQYKATGKSMEAIEARVGKLESDVIRLVDEVEGGEYGEAVGTIAEDGEDEQDAEDLVPNFRKQRRASGTE